MVSRHDLTFHALCLNFRLGVMSWMTSVFFYVHVFRQKLLTKYTERRLWSQRAIVIVG